MFLLRLLRILFFASLTALGTFVAVPLPYCSIGLVHLPHPNEWIAWHSISLGLYTTSAQVLALAAAGTFLGPLSAFLSQGFYLLAGFAGLPIFANGGGLLYLHSRDFPVLLAFPFAAWLTARISQKGGFWRRMVALGIAQFMILGVAIAMAIREAGPIALHEAWSAVIGPTLQAFPSLLIAVVPLASMGFLGDRIRASLPVPQPTKPPSRKELPSAEKKATESLRLPGPPERLPLPEAKKRKALEGPPQRLFLPGQSEDPQGR